MSARQGLPAHHVGRGQLPLESHLMNKDQFNGALKNALGRLQEHAGKTTGNPGQQSKGVVRQSAGRLQRAYGNVKEALRGSRHS